MSRPKLQVIENFDPTPEETALAERAKSIKLPLCIKCKLASAMPIADTAQASLSDAFSKVADLLTSHRAASLRRLNVEEIKTIHKHLSRASKGRYCTRCFDGAISFATQVVTNIRKEISQ